MKKVVVVYPHPHIFPVNVTAMMPTGEKPPMIYVGEKTFETKTEEEYLTAINKPDGCLVITCNAQIPKYKPLTLAVFKEWIYWEQVIDK